MIDNAREVCGSVKVGKKNPKNVWRNDVVKAPVQRRKTAWKEVLRARDEVSKESCLSLK